MTDATLPFKGFGEKALPFFKALDFHQNREWFQENRALYDSDVYEPLCALVVSISEACASRGLPLRGSPKASIFRIHRDVRFSKDKRPYKAHASAVLTRSGAKNDNGLFYVHIAPDGCFCAAGFYDLDSPKLAAFRQALLTSPAKFKALQARLGETGLEFDRRWSLKRPPREAAGIEDAQIIEALKLKSFITRRTILPERIHGPGLVEDCVGFIEASLPLLDYGWSILASLEPERG